MHHLNADIAFDLLILVHFILNPYNCFPPSIHSASARTLIDSSTLDVDPKATRWNRFIPNKVNVFIWRLMLNKLPTRVNLDMRDIDVGSLLCPICLEDLETVNHIIFSCNMAKDLWSLFAKRWEIDIPVCANAMEWFEWLGGLAITTKVRSKGRYLDVVKYEIFSRALLREGHIVSETAKPRIKHLQVFKARDGDTRDVPPMKDIPPKKDFLSPKGRERSNGVKEKQINMADVSAKANDSVDLDTTSTYTNQAPLKPQKGNLLMGGLSWLRLSV
uniref:RNA-directed DNA polymerase, eukaryota n=1 Tax=Tanacetum cinerariifolium TaxID=118510 RepID=A0A6L2M3Q9_TANCI|nr:RNA-directed DNA polymerase, eukaryota [Tanacetum cinerariifolium]